MISRLKYIPLILILSLFTTSLVAQSMIGFLGGYNQSSFFVDILNNPHYTQEQYGTSKGYCFSILYKDRKHKKLNFTSDLTYLQGLFNVKETYAGLAGNRNQSNVAVNLRYVYISIFPELVIGDKISIDIGAGPTLGFLMNSSQNGTINSYDNYGNLSSAQVVKGSAGSNYSELDLRVFVSSGISLPLFQKLKLYANTSLSYGLNNMTNSDIFVNSKIILVKFGILYQLDSFNIMDKINKNKPSTTF